MTFRVVGPDEQPEPPKTLTLEEAAAAGDRLAELKAMRMVIARALPGAAARDMAALSRRQIEIGREIEAIESEKGDEVGRAASTPDDAWDSEAI